MPRTIKKQMVVPAAMPQIDVSKSQWYMPPELAQRIVDWALYPLAAYASVLEPSAGQGAIARAIRDSGRRVAIGSPFCVELDHGNALDLEREGFEVWEGNFLNFSGSGYRYDLAIMNPPFENGQTEDHILHALKLCDHVVVHGPLTTLEGQARKRDLWDKHTLTDLIVHSKRIKYSGRARNGMTAMCTMKIIPGSHRVRTQTEWW